MSDLVKRLRNDEGIGINLTLCREAADEIERLRAQVAALREALEFYADRNFDGYQVDVTDYGLYGLSTDCGHIIEDAGTIARAALEEK